MLDLNKYVVPCLHKKWKDFAYQLLKDEHANRVITEIEENIKGDVAARAGSLFQKWLDLDYSDTTWNRVIETLREVASYYYYYYYQF